MLSLSEVTEAKCYYLKLCLRELSTTTTSIEDITICWPRLVINIGSRIGRLYFDFVINLMSTESRNGMHSL
jgi:hypothetical protein